MTHTIHAVAAGLTATLIAACSSSSNIPTDQTPPLGSNQILTTNATIRFVNMEGGCWAIETAPGTRYEPVNLAAGFQTDGLQVRVVLRDAPNAYGVCQMAPYVTIDSISTP